MGKKGARSPSSTLLPRSHRGNGVNRIGSEILAKRRSRRRISLPISSQKDFPIFSSLGIAADPAESDGGDDDGSSVFSEFDVLNDAIQEFLLESDDSEGENSFDFHGDEITTTYALKPFLNSSRRVDVSCFCGGENNTVPSTTVYPVQSSTITLVSAEGMLQGCCMQKCPGNGGSNGISTRRCHHGEGLLPHDRGLPGAPLCVVLDLDETLVSARREAVHLRPHVKEFLDACHAEGCEIVLWSAGSPSHVNKVIRAVSGVTQRSDWYHHFISRHRRWYRDGGESVKDISVLGRPVGQVILVENDPHFVQLHPQHSVLVEDYVYPTEHDESLRVLADVVRRVAIGMREAGGKASANVPLLLSADSALLPILFSSPSINKGVISSRGLRYSPKNVFASRKYGGQNPLTQEPVRRNDKSTKRRRKKKIIKNL